MKEKTRQRLAKVGEVMSSGGFSLLTPKKEIPAVKSIAESRGEFIDEAYPHLFGEEEMGDPARVITPAEVTAVLQGYEAKLAFDGLLKTKTREE
jgi:hypothetical protein